MAKQTFETIEKKRKLFAQRVVTMVLIFVGIFALTYVIGLAATRHNARTLVEPSEVVSEEKQDDGQQKDEAKDDDKQDKQDEASTQEAETAQAANSNGHTIYLTFDDGPGIYTERLLDILKEHDVKATFFVTHVFSKYENLLKREAKEGHSVAIHSYSHDYDKIYASTDAYWADFDAMQQVIVKQTGAETKMFRFPGGSSNTVSKGTPGIMTQLVKQANEKGLTYFDWNVASGDAGATKSSATVLQNCKVGAANFKNAVILCHDVKEYTVNAMDEFITWGLQNGYAFAALTPESDGAHHQVNN